MSQDANVEPVVTEPTNPPAEEVVETGNPSWKEILDVIPADFQEIVKPTLEKWDQGVKQKIDDLHSQYDPYKDFASNNIPADQIEQALALREAFEADPNEVVQRAIEAFGLDYVVKTAQEQQQQENTTTEPDAFAEAGLDITKHPEFVQMKEMLEKMSGTFEQQQTASEEAAAIKAHEDELAALQLKHKDDGEFDKNYVTTLMVNGLDGEQAVKQYYDIVNQAAAKLAGTNNTEQVTAPVVMGGDSGSGSGTPEQPVNLGQMKRSDVVNLAVDIINRDKQAST